MRGKFKSTLSVVLAVMTIILIAAAAGFAQQQVRLTTIMPLQDEVRGLRGIVGSKGGTWDWRNMALTDDQFYVGGSMGIGTTTPARLLHLAAMPDAADSAPQIRLEDYLGSWELYGGANFHILKSGIAGDVYEQTRIFIDGYDGNVSIGPMGAGTGQPHPNYKLEVRGTAGKPGGGSWSDSSDIRLKKNVKTIEDAIGKMLKLRGVTYQWKEPAEHGNMQGTYMSIIAQEAEKVFPEWVGTDNKGYKTLGFIGFEALTVEAIRELKKENDELRRQNESIENKINLLEKKIAELR